jgi:hypothetical protein
MSVRTKKKPNDLERYAQNQQGFLGTKLIISSKLVPIIVHHINSGNSGLTRAKPIIPAGAPLADFIYEDVISRAEETIQRYLCGEDELLKTKSQMTKLIVHHLETYHGLLKAVAKETKLALDKRRTRKVPDGNQVNVTAILNKRNAFLELNRKEKELSQILNGSNKAKKENAQRVINQLKERKKELEGNKAIKSYEKGRTLTLGAIPEPTTKLLSDAANPQCKSGGNQYEKQMRHLVFSSHYQPDTQALLVCEDTRVTSINESDYQKWKKERNANIRTGVAPKTSPVPAPVAGVTESGSTRIPFKTLYGDRLVKRRLVLHSFVRRLDSLLYTGFRGTKFQLHPLKARFEGLFMYDKSNNNGLGAINLDTSSLIWDEGIRSFGNEGPQTYWIQLLREMYDAKRVENIRKKTRLLNARNNRAMSPSNLQNTFKNLNLPDNLGVTSYGYTCDPSDTTKPWRKSYHRFGRAWFCDDTNADPYQLPFGCYNDACAPPVKHLSNPNYNANSGMEPSGIKDSLMTIAVNNICTSVLQSQSRLGSQGRYTHIKTAYNGKSIGKMTPSEALRTFSAVRTSSGPDRIQTTEPFFYDSDPFQLKQGPDLRLSILEARKALKPNPPTVVTLQNNGSNNTNNNANNNMNISGSKLQSMVSNTVLQKSENIKNIKNVLFIENKKTINLNALRTDTNRSVALREFLVGTSQWNKTVVGPAKVTGYNLDRSKLHKIGAGLYRSMQDRQNDAETLNRNFFMVDGEIHTVCEKYKHFLMYGGSEAALGIAKKFAGASKQFILPLILPLNAHNAEYKQVKQNATKLLKLMIDDSDSGIKGLVQRQMENVCIPMFEGGSLTKGAHYNDLMNRFLQITKSTEMKGESLEAKLKTPALYNIMKCLQFYLYVHVGLSTQQALNEIERYQVRQNARQSHKDMFSLATKLRMLGDAGPIPSGMFKTIVRQYFLTSASKFNYKERNEVKREIFELRRKMKSFQLFGKDFRRLSIPSVLGGKPKARANMGIPNSGNVKVTKKRSLVATVVNPKDMLIGNTKVRMTSKNARYEVARKAGLKVPAAMAAVGTAVSKASRGAREGYRLAEEFIGAATPAIPAIPAGTKPKNAGTKPNRQIGRPGP